MAEQSRRPTTPAPANVGFPTPWGAPERPDDPFAIGWPPYDPSDPFGRRQSLTASLLNPPKSDKQVRPPYALPGQKREPVAPIGLLDATVRPQFPTGKGFPDSISVSGDVNAGARAPLKELASFSKVRPYDDYIEAAAAKYGVNPDLIRAVMYMETTHGYYDALVSPFNMNASILPMNVNTDYWGNTWGTREQLKSPQFNIDAGTKMLKVIIDRMDNPSVSQVATVYNDSKARSITDYGKRVQSIYLSKPWIEHGQKEEKPITKGSK